VDLLSALELDGLPCYHPVGGIEVAATEERWAELDRRYGRAGGYGLNAALLSPAEVKERIPLIDADRIVGGLFVERDGIAKAVRGAEAMGRAAAARGRTAGPRRRASSSRAGACAAWRRRAARS